ncbi:MAG: phosphonoacetaldehyde hydrolase [Tannerella sp.]|jgi:phosphonoacetaldehyde hydrolase|nr:phosphonoacetaldehyde hydrolase [Tannerella sp.]
MKHIKAIVCDWAGTTVDFGCMAPAKVFVDVFARQGIDISLAEARRPMGLAKRDHIEALLREPAIVARWKTRFGRAPDAADSDFLYGRLEPQLAETVVRHNDLIPGTLGLQQWCRDSGIGFGSTTGYVASMMKNIVGAVAARGFVPDCIVSSDEVPAGRPAPFMVFENMKRMNVYPASRMVKLGDTAADMGEGRNAGMWCVGFTLSGNETGLTRDELERLPETDRQACANRAADRLRAAGAHCVCDGIWDVIPLLEQIDRQMQ